MPIFLNKNSKIVVQGMTGPEGRKCTTCMLAYDAKIMAGTSPKEAGISIDFDVTPYGPLVNQLQDGTVSIPVYGTMAEVKTTTGANTSVIFVPPAAAKGAIFEAVGMGLDLVVIITGYIPVQDTSFALTYARERGVRVIRPNYPGIISLGKSDVGVTPGDITPQGHLSLVSKSGTLTYQVMYGLCDLGLTTYIRIGDDPIIGTAHIDAPAAFEQDLEAKSIVTIGEIGGDAEERVVVYTKEHATKPVMAYVAGFTAPEGKTMGHAGVIVSGSSGTAATRKGALEAVGVKVDKTPSETAWTAREIINAR